jgi:2-methylcitrate dehydratase PrpD
LLRLDEEAILNAMSIAFSMASGSKKQFGSMMKPTHAGLAAQHAVMSAKMASKGMTGNNAFLSGAWSFQELYGDSNPRKAESALTNLGEPFLHQGHCLLVKRFPCCASAHKTLDGLLELKEKHNLAASDIKYFKTRLPETLSRNLPFAKPKNEMEARFCMPYVAARILQEGHLSLQHFTKKAVKDFENNILMDRIVIETIPDPVEISLTAPLYSCVELKDGNFLEIEIKDLKGSNTNPLSKKDMQTKFTDCLQFIGKKEIAEELFFAAMSVADIDRISILTEQFSELFKR